MKTQFIFPVLLCWLITSVAMGQQNKSQAPVFHIIPASPDAPKPDSIVIAFWKENVSSSYQREQLLAEKTSNGFVFHMPAISHLSSFRLIFCYGKQLAPSKFYFAEPSDRMTITYTKATPEIKLVFSGQGAAKYNILDSLDQLTTGIKKERATINVLDILKKLETKDYCNSPEFKEYVDWLFKIVQQGEQKTQQLIKDQAKSLGTDLAKLYSYEYSNTKEFEITMHGLFINTKDQNSRQAIAKLYFNKSKLLERTYDNPLGRYSFKYSFYTTLKTIEEGHMLTGIGLTLKESYAQFKAINDPDLRERMITHFFYDPTLRRYISSTSGMDSCLKDAINMASLLSCKSALRQLLLFSAGSKVYDFSFADSLGNYTSLSDVKGKVFLLEFYGEGCSGCALFSKMFKKDIYPEFASNPDFKVISVSVDRTRERWMRAINSGLYTLPSYINLNTGPEGIQHPMLKHYNLNAIPFLLLVGKNGKLIAKIDSQSPEAISTLIRKGLNEPHELNNSSQSLAE